MAGKPKQMTDIKQILILHKQGKPKKAIARILGISKNTVKAYLNKIQEGELTVDGLLKKEDDKLEAALFAGNPSYKDPRYEYLKERLSYYVGELKKVGVTRHLLWKEYRKSCGDGYGYTQFKHHLNQYMSAQSPSMVLEHTAGEKLFIDYAGKKLSYVDRDTGEVIACQVFVACLPYSDYSFAMVVPSQNISDFTYALSCCLEALGGVPQTLVPDNLKSAITKASRYEPDVNRALKDLANHYGTTVTPARAGKPKDKALVENQVRLVYSRVYARLRDRLFFDLHSLNAAISEKIKDHNQTRMQQKGYCREEKFISEERATLAPLPEKRFELKYYTTLKVAQNNHVCMGQDKHYYSVPFAYIGKKVQVRYTRSMVYICSDHKQIAVHVRNYARGTYSTHKDHLCSQHQHYLDRSPAWYLDRAKRSSDELHLLFEHIFRQDKYPEQLYRTCDGLLSLWRKTDQQVFSDACSMAVEHHNYSYQFVNNILNNNMASESHDQEGCNMDKPLPSHENKRGKEHYR